MKKENDLINIARLMINDYLYHGYGIKTFLEQDYDITKVLGVIAKTVGDIFSYLPKIFNILSIIAMNVAVFYAFRNIVKGLVFFKTL